MLKKAILYTVILILPLTLYSFFGNSRFFEIAKNISLYSKLYKELNENYVDNVEPADLMQKGIKGMLKSLDPFTNFITESQVERFRMKRKGAANIGVGLVKRKDGYVYISNVQEGLAAQKAGIIVGDKIISVAGKSAKDRTVDDIKQILQGQAGTDVTLKITHQGESTQKNITAKRGKALPKSVPYYGMLNEETAYVNLKTFLKPGCSNEVVAAVKDLQSKNEVKNLVFDLRHNGGGLLKEAINMCNIFINKGELVVTTKGKIEDWFKEYKTKQDPVLPDMPVVVLVDERSASASEILAGTLQDLDRGVVVGTRTYGKGLVQQTKKLPYNAQFKLTVAKYYTPSGRCVQAIDYSEQDAKGKKKMADSLRTEFKTRAGRSIFDGSGVEPDVEIEKPAYAKLVQTLIDKHLISDYASIYRLKNDSIAAPKSFEFGEKDFNEFVQFITTKDYEYQTKTEKVIAKLRKSADKEKYSDAISTTLNNLESKITQEKKQDLKKYKKDLMKLLKLAIVERYYYQKGKLILSLDDDPNVKMALSLFDDASKYKGILGKK